MNIVTTKKHNESIFKTLLMFIMLQMIIYYTAAWRAISFAVFKYA